MKNCKECGQEIINTMTVGQLKEKLKVIPDDLKIVISRDPEGNGYSPLGIIFSDKMSEYGEAADINDEDMCLFLEPKY